MNEIATAERERIVAVLKEALARGYTPEQIKQYVQGIVDFNEEGAGG